MVLSQWQLGLRFRALDWGRPLILNLTRCCWHCWCSIVPPSWMQHHLRDGIQHHFISFPGLTGSTCHMDQERRPNFSNIPKAKETDLTSRNTIFSSSGRSGSGSEAKGPHKEGIPVGEGRGRHPGKLCAPGTQGVLRFQWGRLKGSRGPSPACSTFCAHCFLQY